MGLANDGGLYVPESWPQVSLDTMLQWQSLNYADLAVEVMSLFVGDDITHAELKRMSKAAYANFHHPAIAPLQQLEEKLWIMELYHGPTLAFKDFAMQFLGQLFEHILEQKNSHRTIVGATSGDTGSAAIEAVRGMSRVRLFMLHPKGRVSEVQRRQMTTVQDANIVNIAVDGDFDDCQRLLKQMFNDAAFRDEVKLSAVNSINWARVAAQVVYYFKAALTLGAPQRSVSFAVPSGNFGNVFAGYVAKQMGLSIEQFVVGSNRNDILTRFFQSGEMKIEGVAPSITPSMDIQVSSNFERLLFELTGRDGAAVSKWMHEFSTEGSFKVAAEQHRDVSQWFTAGSLSDQQTRDEMLRLHNASQYLVDPHSAIGVATARQAMSAAALAAAKQVPMVVLATAHPAKFPDAVRDAVAIEASLPKHVEHIMQAPEHMQESAAELSALQTLIRATPTME